MKKIIVSVISIIVLLLFIGLSLVLFNKKGKLLSWNENSFAKKEIINYVSEVTKKSGDNYIPVEDRIAVFDFDGTLYAENDPTYISWNIFLYRVLEDSNYNATKEQLELATKIKDDIKNGKKLELGSSQTLIKNQVFKGMTLNKYINYIERFLNTSSNKNPNITRKEEYFKQMVEVIEYLQDNKFTIYICSGTDRYIVRTLIKDVIDIPDSQVIGTDNLFNIDENYNIKLTENTGVKNVNMNKVNSIIKEIGKKPVLSFGNSSSDINMNEFTTTNNKYKSKAFMITNDENIIRISNDKGWIIINSKIDWK